MKRTLRFLIPLIAAFVIGITFTQCKKDHGCTMRITCHFSETGLDTGKIAPKTLIVVGKDTYADFARDSSYTNEDGVYEHVFQYPALLDVKAIFSDTTWDEEGNPTIIEDYTGAAQVQINDGETTEKTILLVKTGN